MGAGGLAGLMGGMQAMEKTTEAFWNRRESDQANSRASWANENAIRIRVRDALAAGIHPLYALGASVQSPSFIAGQAPSGSVARDAIEMYQRGREAREASRGKPISDIDKAQIRALDSAANRDEAMALAELSKIGKDTEQAQQRPPFWQEYIDQYTGQIIVQPTAESGLEYPETLGAIIWAQGKEHQARLNNEARKLEMKILSGRAARAKTRRGRRDAYRGK